MKTLKKIKLKDITTEINANFILCKYLDAAGNVIKMKYQFYSLTQAKKQFLIYLNTSF
jgi:hypothetical protein